MTDLAIWRCHDKWLDMLYINIHRKANLQNLKDITDNATSNWKLESFMTSLNIYLVFISKYTWSPVPFNIQWYLHRKPINESLTHCNTSRIVTSRIVTGEVYCASDGQLRFPKPTELLSTKCIINILHLKYVNIFFRKPRAWGNYFLCFATPSNWDR